MGRRKTRKLSPPQEFFFGVALSLGVILIVAESNRLYAGDVRGNATCALPDSCATPTLIAPPDTAGRPMFELPAIASGEFVLTNPEGRFTMFYDTLNRQAAWVAYMLTRADVVSGSVTRASSFYIDPQVKEKGWNHATNADYRASGYDKGHLLPSADRLGSRDENRATFALSNASPQHPELNRKGWKNLEERVRQWAVSCDTLYIVTGSIVRNGVPAIGKNRVSVPVEFYKAILSKSGSRYRCIGFVMPNHAGCEADFFLYATTIDRLEEATGLDFFPLLPDSIETIVEGNTELRLWQHP